MSEYTSLQSTEGVHDTRATCIDHLTPESVDCRYCHFTAQALAMPWNKPSLVSEPPEAGLKSTTGEASVEPANIAGY